MRLHLITAEDPLTREARSRELIRSPQLAMPPLAALTPAHWTVSHTDEITHVVFRPRLMTPDQLLSGYEWAKTAFHAPVHIARRMWESRTGLWWNIPRNLGYWRGLTGEVRARARMHEVADAH